MQKNFFKTYSLFASITPLKRRVGSGSVNQCYGFAGPDPDQRVRVPYRFGTQVSDSFT
jgi:hypothetical protein